MGIRNWFRRPTRYNLPGLATVNIELTNRCNAKCSCCGRRKIERDYPHLANYDRDMPFSLLEKIEPQLPPDITVQFHWNGEPLLYPELGRALLLFHRQIRCLNTNGLLLSAKAEEIIGNLDSLAFSVVPDDPQADAKFDTLAEFLSIKRDRLPRVVIRILGNVDRARYQTIAKNYGCLIATRTLHSPMGSFDYDKPVTIPETGICHDLLTHPAIDVAGWVSVCVRLDPCGHGVLGNLYTNTIEELWNGPSRSQYLYYHRNGLRDELDICRECHFYGLPTP